MNKETYLTEYPKHESMRENVKKDKNRLHFHMMPPTGWMNDPNGLCEFQGVNHIYFQYTPFLAGWGTKLWGHYTTKDWIHYKEEEPFLYPDEEWDRDGVYSGSAYTCEDGIHYFYTGNVKLWDKDYDYIMNGREQNTIHVFSPDGKDIAYKKLVMTNDDYPVNMSKHVRDPKIYKKDGRYYMIQGGRDAESYGCALLFCSDDLEHWKWYDTVRTAKPFGYMWECPNLLQFGRYDVLLFCPQGLPARSFDRQNLYQAGYIAGHLSLDSLDMVQHTKFQELDHGFDFYAPQAFEHEGRHILIGWMGMPDRDDEYPSREKNWQYSLTMPRELRLRQGHIYSRPVREMRDLRVEESAIELERTNVRKLVQPLFQGSEILLNIKLGQARKVVLTLAFGLEELVFAYDCDEQVMTIDRNGMHKGGRGIRQFKLFADTQVSLELFVDRSAIEAFFQHGEEAASLLVFPEKNIQPELRLTASEPLAQVTGNVWSLDAFKYQSER